MRPLVLAVALLMVGAISIARADDKEDEVVLSLEKLSAPFDKDAVIETEQKDGKFKKYKPMDHEKFDKEVDDRDLEVVEMHIKDRKIIRLVFGVKKK